MAGGSREKVKLVSKEGTKFFYSTTKRTKGADIKKLAKRKFDPWMMNEKTGKCGCHVDFYESSKEGGGSKTKKK